MRILSIGRSSNSSIVINSQYASSDHAEIYQLDNGDMYIVDQNSSNGTFVNGSRIAPGQEVAIRRGDNIQIADVPLQWNWVPVLKAPTDVKVLKSIGSHYLNTIQISGEGVSRFHATVKLKNDGKWYICDHSTNGTTVNGMRIPKEQDYQIKKGDSIMCAGLAITNPVEKTSNGKPWAIVGICAGVCAVIGLLVFFIFGSKDGSKSPISGPVTPEKIYAAYAPATVLINVSYYFEVSALGYSSAYVVYDPYAEEDEAPFTNYDSTNAMTGQATGFFVSEDGKIVTNLHVVNPALYGTDKAFSDMLKIYYQELNKGDLAMADINVNSKLLSISIIPNGCFPDVANKYNCRIFSQSENPQIDLAVIQTLTESLPSGSTYVNLTSIQPKLAIASEVYSIGFPLSYYIQETAISNVNASKKLEATFAKGSITNNNKYNYQFNATTAHGSSGSPVFDSKGHLVGVVSAKFSAHDDFNIFEKAENIEKLLKD